MYYGDGGQQQRVIANGVKASGAIVKMNCNDFETLLQRINNAVVLRSYEGLFIKSYKYLANYKGFFIFTTSKKELILNTTEIIEVQKIWIPQ